jgi:DNA-binding NarL/FixJ family response regulator
MAAELRIHVRTLDFHLWNLRRKVHANSLIDLAVRCARMNGELSD